MLDVLYITPALGIAVLQPNKRSANIASDIFPAQLCGLLVGGRLQRVRQRVGPAPRDSEGEYRVVQFTLGVSGRTIPAALFPENVVKIGVSAMVHP
jgi:hypothetical protein